LVKRSVALVFITMFWVVLGVMSTSFVVAQSQDSYIKNFNVKAFRFGFDPPILVVNQGDIVVITVNAVDAVHGFYIEDYEVRQDSITPNSPITISFIADKVGMFRIHCSTICGPLHPFMIGQLIVQPSLRFIGSTLFLIGISATFITYIWLKEDK